MLRDPWRITVSSREHHTEGALPTRSDSTQVVLGFRSTLLDRLGNSFTHFALLPGDQFIFCIIV
jgi:hypothetical protein